MDDDDGDDDDDDSLRDAVFAGTSSGTWQERVHPSKEVVRSSSSGRGCRPDWQKAGGRVSKAWSLRRATLISGQRPAIARQIVGTRKRRKRRGLIVVADYVVDFVVVVVAAVVVAGDDVARRWRR